MTPPVTPPHIAAQVREQVAQARDAAGHAARGASHGADGHDDYRDYVRHYLRYLSTHAIGRFASALGQLAGGLESLSHRTADTSARLARTEQDVLQLAAAFENSRALPSKLQELETRLARAEGRLWPIDRVTDNGASTSGGRAEDGGDRFVAAVVRHVPLAPSAQARAGVTLGPLPAAWVSIFEAAGYRMQTASADGSADLVIGLCTLDGLANAQAASALRDARRALRAGGVLLAVVHTMPADERPASLAQVLPRIAGASDVAVLAREVGFQEVRAEALDTGWPAFGVAIGRR